MAKWFKWKPKTSRSRGPVENLITGVAGSSQEPVLTNKNNLNSQPPSQVLHENRNVTHEANVPKHKEERTKTVNEDKQLKQDATINNKEGTKEIPPKEEKKTNGKKTKKTKKTRGKDTKQTSGGNGKGSVSVNVNTVSENTNQNVNTNTNTNIYSDIYQAYANRDYSTKEMTPAIQKSFIAKAKKAKNLNELGALMQQAGNYSNAAEINMKMLDNLNRIGVTKVPAKILIKAAIKKDPALANYRAMRRYVKNPNHPKILADLNAAQKAVLLKRYDNIMKGAAAQSVGNNMHKLLIVGAILSAIPAIPKDEEE